MLYAVYRLNGVEEAGVFDCSRDYFEATFDPDTEIIGLIEFKTHGKTYQERKEYVRDQAIEYSNINGYADISYMELSMIQEYFTRMGERYHLMDEFKENAIC